MRISPKNAKLAMQMVGLPAQGPIRQEALDAKIVQASRLAKFMDQLDRPLPEGLTLPAIRNPM